MTEPVESPAICRVQVVIYAPRFDTGEQDRAVALCKRWAAAHDWDVVAIVRETDDSPMPLERVGMRTVLEQLSNRRSAAALAASQRHICDGDITFDAVCLRVEQTGGFLHVLGEPKETP